MSTKQEKDTLEELTIKLSRATSMLSKFQRAINEIDDYFEYTMESKTDQSYVRQVLKNLTDSLMDDKK